MPFKDPDMVRAANRKSYKKYAKKVLTRQKQQRASKDGWAHRRLIGLKHRAKRKGWAFNLTLEDLIVPEFCPVLGLKLTTGQGPHCPSSASVDRMDNSKGYIKGNVRVISYRANALKSNATAAEMEKILSYMRGEL